MDEFLQQALQNRLEEFRELHQIFSEKFSCDGIHGRIIQNVATLALSDFLAAVNLFGQDANAAMESALKFGEQLLSYVPKANEVKLTKRALEWTLGWLAQHQNKLGNSKSGEQIGDRRGEDVFVIVRIYKDAFRHQFGLDPLLVLREFARDGYLIPHLQGKGTTLEVAHRIGGIPVKCYQFHISQE